MMILGLLVALVGGVGCAVFGVSLAMDALYGAQFKKASGSVPALIQRSIKGSLRPFLISLALLVLGVLLISVCSARKPPADTTEEISDCRPPIDRQGGPEEPYLLLNIGPTRQSAASTWAHPVT
jgi:hypothetical protein